MTDRPTLTRRGLLRGLGTATVVAGCAREPSEPATTAPEPPADLPAGATAIGPGPAPLRLQVNGEARTLEVPPSTTLLVALRDHLGLRAAKEVCDRGACGACMVLVDGEPMNSCMMLAHDGEGRELTTVEGLAPAGELTALQRQMIAHDGLQCGFCTPGMVISATALLRRGGPVDRDAAEQAIAGNLCRCGSYPHIVAAIVDAAGQGGTHG
ncbi:MAG: (2Fe-2S)-binding protein [Nannocystaceae bacterium]